jgi:hypothetical protein
MTWTTIRSVSMPIAYLIVCILLATSLYFDLILYRERLILVQQILLRGIAAIAFMAIYSLSIQLKGLIGEHGLVPITNTLNQVKLFLEDSNLIRQRNQELSAKNDDVSRRKSDWKEKVLKRIDMLKDFLMGCMLRFIYEKFRIHQELTGGSNKASKSNIDNETSDSSEGKDLGEEYLNAKELLSSAKNGSTNILESQSNNKDDKPLTQDEHLGWMLKTDLFFSLFAIAYPHPFLFIYLYLSYYGYKRITGTFLNYQWDILLLETLFLSIPLSFISFLTEMNYSMLIVNIWIIKLLFFRLMFGSGMVKAYGRDESWHTSYSAMSYHFWTQPLPSKLGMMIHLKSPQLMLKAMTIFTLVSEVIFPLMSLIGLQALPNIRLVLFWSNVLLQLSITWTGYYGKYSDENEAYLLSFVSFLVFF